MTQENSKYRTAAAAVIILAVSIIISGCAPLLVGAGAVGGYKVAEHTNAHDND